MVSGLVFGTERYGSWWAPSLLLLIPSVGVGDEASGREEEEAGLRRCILMVVGGGFARCEGSCSSEIVCI